MSFKFSFLLLWCDNNNNNNEKKKKHPKLPLVLEFSCGAASQLAGSTISNFATNLDVAQRKEPLGVCLGVCPFNFPGELLLHPKEIDRMRDVRVQNTAALLVTFTHL